MKGVPVLIGIAWYALFVDGQCTVGWQVLMVCFWDWEIFSPTFLWSLRKTPYFYPFKEQGKAMAKDKTVYVWGIADRNHRSGWGVVLRAGNGTRSRSSLYVGIVRRPSHREDFIRCCRGSQRRRPIPVGQIVTDEEPRLDMH